MSVLIRIITSIIFVDQKLLNQSNLKSKLLINTAALIVWYFIIATYLFFFILFSYEYDETQAHFFACVFLIPIYFFYLAHIFLHDTRFSNSKLNHLGLVNRTLRTILLAVLFFMISKVVDLLYLNSLAKDSDISSTYALTHLTELNRINWVFTLLAIAHVALFFVPITIKYYLKDKTSYIYLLNKMNNQIIHFEHEKSTRSIQEISDRFYRKFKGSREFGFENSNHSLHTGNSKQEKLENHNKFLKDIGIIKK